MRSRRLRAPYAGGHGQHRPARLGLRWASGRVDCPRIGEGERPWASPSVGCIWPGRCARPSAHFGFTRGESPTGGRRGRWRCDLPVTRGSDRSRAAVVAASVYNVTLDGVRVIECDVCLAQRGKRRSRRNARAECDVVDVTGGVGRGRDPPEPPPAWKITRWPPEVARSPAGAGAWAGRIVVGGASISVRGAVRLAIARHRSAPDVDNVTLDQAGAPNASLPRSARQT